MRAALLCLVPLALLAACTQDQGFIPEQEDPEKPYEDTAPPYEEPPALPVAVCSVSPNPVTPPFETAAWDGSGSYDPEGGTIVTYEWTLAAKPSGSAMVMPPGDAIRPGFTPDLAGDYVGQLVVTNDLGDVSDPCTVTLESIPAEDLWVEMYWTHRGDDMDLHLLKPGATRSDLESNSDCYYANCVGGGPDWGQRGNANDDPSLDLDDIPGTGPENINVLQPESGTYTVYVHDYPGSTYNGENMVTVNIYLNGGMVWTGTKNVNQENGYVPFAAVDWTSGTVNSL